MKTRSLAIIFALLLLSACGQSATVTPVGTPTVVLQPTGTASETRIPILSPTMLREPIDTIAPTQTWNPTAALKATLVAGNLCKGYYDLTWSSSPDNQWIVCSIGDGFDVANSTTKYHFPLQDWFGSTDTWLNQAIPIHWNQDGKYVFITFVGPAEGPGDEYYHGNGLLRVDLQDGTITNTIPGCTSQPSCWRWNHGGSFSISPTDRRLAYIDGTGADLVLTLSDLKTGASHSIPLDRMYSNAGQFHWSQDGLVLITALAGPRDKDAPFAPVFTDIMVLNVQTLAYQTFRINKADFFYFDDYKDNSLFFHGYEGAYWAYDLNSLALLSQPTPTR
jgi:hypothetical protein